MENVFKTLTNHKEIELFSYIENFLIDFPETKIYIGCDSQNRKQFTIYAIVIALHEPSKGGHVLYSRIKLPRIKDRSYRLWNEVEYSVALAKELEVNGLPKPDFIDIDINPDPRWKSNSILVSAIGYVKSMGYQCRCKPDAMTASYVADHLIK